MKEPKHTGPHNQWPTNPMKFLLTLRAARMKSRNILRSLPKLRMMLFGFGL
jgi:hypothetical protein